MGEALGEVARHYVATQFGRPSKGLDFRTANPALWRKNGRARMPTNRQWILKRRPAGDIAPGDLESFFLTDEVFRMPAVELADAQAPHAPVFQYRFDWRSPAWGGMLGAAHALEIPFVFNCVADPKLAVFVGDEPPAALAQRVHDAWVAFAATGVPTVPGTDEWPAIGATGGGRPVLLFSGGEDGTDLLADDPVSLTREFWASARSTF